MSAPDPFALDGGDGDAVAEAHELAAIDFQPVDNTAMLTDFSQPTYNKMMADIGIDLRMSALFLGETKPKLVAFARDGLKGEGNPEDFYQLIERLGDTAKRLRSLQEIVTAAFARLQSAGSVVAIED